MYTPANSCGGGRDPGGTILTGRARFLFCFIFFYAVLANIPFWTAGYLLGLLHNRMFCLEFALVGLVALFVPRIWAGVLLFLTIAADLICAISQTFYLSPAECLRSSSFLYLISGPRLLLVGGVIALVLLLCLIAASFPLARISKTDRWIAAACLVAFTLVCVSADFVAELRATGQVPNPFRLTLAADSVKSSYLNGFRFSRLTTIQLARNAIWSFAVSNRVLASEARPSTVPSAADMAVRSERFTAGKGSLGTPNLVLVLVESWGQATDLSIRNLLAQPYLQPDLASRYEVSQGAVPFHGSTVPGEARELCDSDTGFHLLNASAQELESCLPDRLAALGYYNIAVHGMDGHMFNRSTWYNTIGFQEKWFRDQFRREGLPDCVGAFVGTCDASIAEWIGHRLQRQGSSPDFLYWVTLNSHLPVPIPPPLRDAERCSFTPPLSQQPGFCSWYQLVSNVHHSVAKLAMADLGRPTVFVIVGDHAPPFANPAVRDQFSSVAVPYVVLTPRSNNNLARRLSDSSGRDSLPALSTSQPRQFSK
jgi:hypothetical protein